MNENDSIVTDFVEEMGELLDAVMDDVLGLEDNFDQETINRIFRSIHSAKGNAGMLGFMSLSSFAHSVEDVFGDIRSGEREMDKATADVILACLDTIKGTINLIETTGTDDYDFEPSRELLTSFEAAESSSPEPESVASSPTEEEEVVAEEEEVVATVDESPKAEVLRILIVEDDLMSRMVLASFFAKYGLCHVAKDGLEAVQAVVESFENDPPQPYDLICMDIMMPGMDGLQASRTIREIETGKGVSNSEDETVIVMTSALDDEETILKATYECGANQYFTKPLNLEDMRKRLGALLGSGTNS